jgi:hypothetical protein
MANGVFIQISIGEMFDRLSILEIKLEKIQNPEKLRNVRYEYEVLETNMHPDIFEDAEIQQLYNDLLEVNTQLWDIEDLLRIYERDCIFGEAFIALARTVYVKNDRRASIKRKLNEIFQQDIMEEKEYVDYSN